MNQKYIENASFASFGQIMQNGRLFAIPFVSLAQEQNWERDKVEVEIEEFTSKSSFASFAEGNKDERNLTKKIIWYVSSELVGINFIIFELINKSELTYGKLSLLLVALEKLSKYRDYLPANLSAELFLQTERLNNIAADFERFAENDDFAAFLTKPCSFWFSYTEAMEFKEEFQSLAKLRAEIENHLQHWPIIQWIIELFSNISQKICWYIHMKLDLLVDSLSGIDTKTALFSGQSNLDSLNSKSKQLADEYLGLREYFSSVQDKFISLELARCQRFFNEFSNTDDDLTQRPILPASVFAEVISLSQDRNGLEKLISYCAGLLGIKIIGRSYREVFAEITEQSKLLRISTKGTPNYYLRKNSGEFVIVEDTHQLVKWLGTQGLLNDKKLQLLLEYAEMYPSGDVLVAEGDKWQSGSNNSYEEGSFASADIVANSNARLSEAMKAYPSSNILGVSSVADSLIIFENFFEKKAFLKYLLKTYFSNKKITDSKSCFQNSGHKKQPETGPKDIGKVLSSYEQKESTIIYTLEKLNTELEAQEEATQKLEQKFEEISYSIGDRFESGVQDLFKRLASKSKRSELHVAEFNRHCNSNKNAEVKDNDGKEANEGEEAPRVAVTAYKLSAT